MRGCCHPPQSVTNVYNTSLAASQFVIKNTTVPAGLIITLDVIPGAGFFMLFLDAVLQTEGDNYTVDYENGLVTMIGATIGQTVNIIYIGA